MRTARLGEVWRKVVCVLFGVTERKLSKGGAIGPLWAEGRHEQGKPVA